MKKVIRIVSLGILYFLINNYDLSAQTTELWGTNFRGGDDNQGRIVKVTAASVVSQAHGFGTTHPGKGESFLKPLNYNGFLYILSSYGGSGDVGVLTKYDPSTNTSTRLFNFDKNIGYTPYGCNLLVYNNKFYGMTQLGGANNLGTIYEFDPATNVVSKKYDFTAALGQPYVSRFEVFNNKFYTCTGAGGANNMGTLIEYDPVTNIVVKKLDLSNDGIIGRGNISGMTLYSGKFYGSMQFINNSEGCIFEYDPTTNIYTKKIILTGSSVRNICGKFLWNGTSFYLTSNQGDGDFGQGTIAEYNPTTNVLTTKIQFAFGTGAGCFGDLVLYNGKYYGTNTFGATNNVGAFFEWDPITNTITKNKPAGGSVGDNPYSSFTIFNNKLYTTCSGSNLNLGYKSTMVEWDVFTNIIVHKFSFSSGDGESINTKLLYHNAKIYGTTPRGGSNSNGILFSKDVNTGMYTQLYQFPSYTFLTSGISYSPLNVFNNKIYGVSNTGGLTPSDVGYIYEWDIATATFTKKINLSATTGNNVIGQLYLHSNNKFYGISRAGGAGGTGTIFSWDPTTNVYTVIMPAPQGATGGFVAVGSLLYVPVGIGGGGYGSVYAFNIATSSGLSVAAYSSSIGTAVGEFTALNGILYTGTMDGSSSSGNILSFNPTTNSISILKSLSPAFPIGAANIGSSNNGMLAAYNNELYGFCTQGGLNGLGTTFKYNPTTNIFTKLEDNAALGGTRAADGNGFITIQTTATLPIKLNYFDAIKKTPTSALLTWETAQEINTDRFEVEKSIDAITFDKIGTIKAAGYSVTNKSYQLIDNNPIEGFNYYRLKQIDNDNRFEYTATRALQFKDINTGSIKYYPNPTNGILTIELSIANSNELRVVNICNATGAVVNQLKIAANAGNKMQIDLSKYAKGIYFIQVKTASVNSTERIILK
jgi:uncharacterized repeat protein (TIGR03803 family)